LTLGTYLEEHLFREKSTLIHRYALIGQLTAALIHEINNLMGPLNNRLEIFKNKLESFKNNEVDNEKTTFLKNDLEIFSRLSIRSSPRCACWDG
jgi:hypothetical protein